MKNCLLKNKKTRMPTRDLNSTSQFHHPAIMVSGRHYDWSKNWTRKFRILEFDSELRT